MSGKRGGWSGVTWHSEGSKVLAEIAGAYPPPAAPINLDVELSRRSTRAFDALRQGAVTPGPVERDVITARWRQMGGWFSHQGGVTEAHIMQDDLFAAVRDGKIRL